MKDYISMSDLELLKTYKENGDDKMKAAHTLFDRYHLLVCKMEHQLSNRCRNYNIPNVDMEDYDTEAWEAFIKSMDSANLSKITREDYGHYIRFIGYLKAMNRDIINSALRDAENTVAMDIYSSDDDDKSMNLIDYKASKTSESPEEEYFKKVQVNIARKSLNNLRNRLSTSQVVILSGLENDIKKNKVCSDLGITMYQYTKELGKIQRMLKTEMLKLGYERKA